MNEKDSILLVAQTRKFFQTGTGKGQGVGVGGCPKESDQVHCIHPCVATSISTLSSQEHCQQGEAEMSSGDTDWGQEGFSWN